VLLGCGSSNTPTTEANAVPVALHLNQGSYSVSSRGATISGTVTKGASVTVNGQSVTVHAGRWHDTLRLHIGGNPIAVAATMTARSPAKTTIGVTRHHTATELEALAAARAVRAEEEQRHESEARERKERQAQEQAEQQKQHQLAECTNGTYVNAAGNTVCKPEESPTVPAGATAKCGDGTYSFSESRSGTCSHHEGVAEWLTG
jgi:Protein of unknown function (DUF3761)/Glucodextranase, domain B